MENSTPFDLNQALSQWRARLQDLGRFRAEELDELEGHLRESIFLLHARGLSIPEAFAIATRRLGSERQLSAEFAKANPQRTWTERAMWMAAGVLVAHPLGVVTTSASNIVLNCAIWSGLNEHVVGALSLLASWIVWVGAAAAAYWVLGWRFLWLDRAARACIQRPMLSGLGLFIGLECLQYGMTYVNRLAEPLFSFFSGHPAPASQPNATVLTTWLLWGLYLTPLLWIAAVPLLAGYAWRKRESPASESAVPFELQPGEFEAARALQGQGISLDEASLILGQRRCQHEVVGPSVGLTPSRGIWLGRAVWMVTGVALSRCLAFLVLTLGWLPVFLTRPAAPLYQHLTGLASTCLSLILGGAMVAGLWWWVTRHPSQSALIGSICRRRPLMAALVLVVVCASIGLGEYALVMRLTHLQVLRANNGVGPIATQYFVYSAALTHLIIPIALLLWLTRRWRSIQANPAPCR